MFAATIALVALLAPYLMSWGASSPLTSLDNYVVDLGYQSNQGEAVVVSPTVFDYPLSKQASYILGCQWPLTLQPGRTVL